MRHLALLGASALFGMMPAAAGAGSDFETATLPTFPLCSGAQEGGSASAAPPPMLVDGLGYAGIASGIRNEEARRWFDQGVRFVWAFDEAEAVRSFQQAQRLEPDCALCFWGEAWARSPTINSNPRTEEFAAAKAASAKAASLAAGLSDRDRALIDAMQVRTGGAADFNAAGYAAAMEKAAARFPTDDAIAVMAADARMQTFDYDRRIRHGTLTQKLLEGVLRRHPDHSGAIHFYIHLSDWIEDEKLAEPYADRLARVAPGASHLVHMPSHTFYGVGRYGDAMKANLAALDIDRAYQAKVNPPETAYRSGLNRHNTNFAIASALMIGEAQAALKTADYFRDLYAKTPDDTGAQYPRASIYFAYGLHGDPAQVFALPEPSAKTPLLRAMRLYARGEALARLGDAKGVRAEAASLAAFRAAAAFPPREAARGGAMAGIAQHVLEGRAAMLEGQPKRAEKAFRKAMALQKKAAFSSDPPTWWYPVRRSVAAALIAGGDYASARNQLLASLAHWPNDPVAYYLLSRAEQGLGRTEAARASLAKARQGWAGDIGKLALAAA